MVKNKDVKENIDIQADFSVSYHNVPLFGILWYKSLVGWMGGIEPPWVGSQPTQLTIAHSSLGLLAKERHKV